MHMRPSARSSRQCAASRSSSGSRGNRKPDAEAAASGNPVVQLLSCLPAIEILRNLGDVLARQAELFQQLARGTGVAEYVVDADAPHGCGQLLAQH